MLPSLLKIYYFEDLLLKDKSWNVHENNIHTLLTEVYKSINNLSPPIMKDYFDLKNTRYDLRSKQLLKLPETSTSRYGTQEVHKYSVLKVA